MTLTGNPATWRDQVLAEANRQDNEEVRAWCRLWARHGTCTKTPAGYVIADGHPCSRARDAWAQAEHGSRAKAIRWYLQQGAS